MDVHSRLDRFVLSFEALDLEGIMDCFSKDATSFFPVHHYPSRLNNKQEITERFNVVLGKIKTAGLRSISLPVQDLMIVDYGETALATFHIRDNELSRRTLLLRKTKEDWFITHLHASNAPLEETG